MRRSVAVSIILCVFFSLVIMAICCGLAHQILYWQKTPEKIYDMAYDYMFAVLLGTGATIVHWETAVHPWFSLYFPLF